LENALIEAGEAVLKENRFPSVEELSLVTANASTGHDLMLLGMATDCARSLRDTHKSLAHIQGTLITPQIMASLNFEQRIILTRTLMELGKFQHGFLKDVHERVDVAKLQVDMLANDHKVRHTGEYSKEKKQVVRETLTHTIKRVYDLKNNDTPADTDAVEVGTEMAEVCNT
jgi:hypothetical protein